MTPVAKFLKQIQVCGHGQINTPNINGIRSLVQNVRTVQIDRQTNRYTQGWNNIRNWCRNLYMMMIIYLFSGVVILYDFFFFYIFFSYYMGQFLLTCLSTTLLFPFDPSRVTFFNIDFFMSNFFLPRNKRTFFFFLYSIYSSDHSFLISYK